MNGLAIIGAPTSAGARRLGQERAPEAFRRAGLVEQLQAAGLDVADLGELPEAPFRPDPEHPKQQNLGQVREVALQVAALVGLALHQHRKPVVVGGDCTIALGVLAALVRPFPDLGLVYFDGDVDLHTPADTVSGILDGMVMAHILGRGANELSHLGPRHPLLPEERILLFGYNAGSGWLDPIEQERLERSSMLKVPVARVRGQAQQAARQALAQLEDRAEPVLVHFDVDVIDFREFPVADVPHDGGLSFGEAMEALQVFVSSRTFAGLVITEFNAGRDEDGTQARRLVQAVARVLGEGHPRWQFQTAEPG